MLYSILKRIIYYSLKLFFRKIHIYGQEVIPAKTPVLLAVNHPTAFLDPVLIATTLRPDIHFILRGDVFTSALTRWFLRGIHTIPIFRFRDGYSSLKNNQATFDYCYQLLKDQEIILILAEGQTRFEKRLRPIQKGTARMAFGAYEMSGDESLQIIPVGVNYRDAFHPRSEVMIEYGNPIHIKDYLADYRENPRKTIREVTDTISGQLKGLVVHVEKEEDAQLIDQLHEINRNEHTFRVWPVLLDSHELLREEYQIARVVNQLPDNKKAKLRQESKAYFDRLKEEGLSDLSLVQSTQYNTWNTLAMLFGFIPFILGYLFNIPPILLARTVAGKKVKRKEFYSSIYFGVATFGYVFYWLFWLLAALIIAYWPLTLLVFIMPFFGYFALLYLELYDRWFKARKVQHLPDQIREELQAQRGALKL